MYIVKCQNIFDEFWSNSKELVNYAKNLKSVELARSPRILTIYFPLTRTTNSNRKDTLVLVLIYGFQQFVWSEFSEEYKPTERRETFYPSVVLADRLYELKITDLPMIPYFPVSSHLEWTDFRYYGLRSANAYVLVFDLSNQDTFQVCIHV